MIYYSLVYKIGLQKETGYNYSGKNPRDFSADCTPDMREEMGGKLLLYGIPFIRGEKIKKKR